MNISVQPQGRTGNRLMQYALGLILAKEKNANFYADQIPYFNKVSYNLHTPNGLKTIKTSMYGNNYYDLDELIKCRANIIVDSYVQKVSPLLKYKDFLRDQFKIENNLLEMPDEDELVIHIRETDYKQIGGYLGDHFYIKLVEMMQHEFKKISIVTDNINTSLIKQLSQMGCKIFSQPLTIDWTYCYFSENELRDFNYMLHSKNLLISHSTFSWWAAFLGHHNKVIVPFSSQNIGLWKTNPGHDDIDLYHHDDITEAIYI